MASQAHLVDIENNLDIKAVLEEFKQYLHDRTTHHLGYPYNLAFNFEDLAPFLKYSINNLGDPFNASNYGVHSRMFEVAVLNFFADLWRIPRDQYWGYITTCGTEGNMLGILYGRKKVPDAVLYCSTETHYSVPKSALMFRIPFVTIPCDENGQMIYDELEKALAARRDKPAIVTCNAGTTVKGASDSILRIREALKRAGFERENYYLHVDGALNGLITPFVDTPEARSVSITFDDDVDSISVSGHKMLGCPMPCGVVVTRKEHMERFASEVDYLNSTDTTIMGSRNGQAALFMWYALVRKGVEGLRNDVKQCIENAQYLQKLFLDEGVKCMLNPFCTTVVFPKPSEKVVQKWQLACSGNIAHVVVMPSIDKKKLKNFFDDFMADRRGSATDKDMATAAAPRVTQAAAAAAASAAPSAKL